MTEGGKGDRVWAMMPGLEGWLAATYLCGFMLAMVLEDDPWPSRLLIAALWPVAIGLLVVVLALVGTAGLVAWPPGLPVAGALIALGLWQLML